MGDITRELLTTPFGNGAFTLLTLAAYTSLGVSVALVVAAVWAGLLAVGFSNEVED